MSDKGIFTGPNEADEWSSCFISLRLSKRYVIRDNEWKKNAGVDLWDNDTLVAPECLGVWKNT